MTKRAKKNTVLGLDLGARTVKAVEIARTGHALSVTGCAYEPVEEPDRYGDAVRAAVKAGGFAADKVVAGVSGRGVLLRTVPLPPDRSEDLDAALREEVEKFLPYDISEARIDYHLFEGDGVQLMALVAAARQRDIEDKLRVLADAGITPVRLDTELTALANSLETANKGGYFLPEGQGAALVDFGASKTLIAVTDGVNHAFREFPVGGVTLTEMLSQRTGLDMREAERLKLDPGENMDMVKDAIYPGIEDIAAEIRVCLDQFRTLSGGREAGLLLLSGGLAMFPGVVSLMGRMTKTEARIFDSFGTVGAADLDPEFVDAHGHKFMIAFGLACHARE